MGVNSTPDIRIVLGVGGLAGLTGFAIMYALGMTPHINLPDFLITPAAPPVTPPEFIPVHTPGGIIYVSPPDEIIGTTILITPIPETKDMPGIIVESNGDNDFADEEDYADVGERLKEAGEFNELKPGEQAGVQIVPESVLPVIQSVQSKLDAGVPLEQALSGERQEVKDFFKYAAAQDAKGIKGFVTTRDAFEVVRINFPPKPDLN